MLRKLTWNEDGYGVACSRRSDSGEWWEVKKRWKVEGKLGRAVRTCGWVGDFWSAKFFFCKPAGQDIFFPSHLSAGFLFLKEGQSKSIFAGCTFFFWQALAGIFFSKSSRPPPRPQKLDGRPLRGHQWKLCTVNSNKVKKRTYNKEVWHRFHNFSLSKIKVR